MTVADVGDAWRAGGWTGARKELVDAVQLRIFRHGEVAVIEHDLQSVDHPQFPEGVEIRVCDSESDWAALSSIANRRTRDRFRRASGRGRICLVAWRGARPVGYTWLSARMDPDLETFPLPLPQDGLYGWDLYVDPSERRAGVGTALTSARILHAKVLRHRVCWRAIDINNLGSMGTVRKTGGRLVGRYRYVKIFGWIHGRMLPPESDSAVG
jgi:GNAT superfamily N-acetyltransferase